MSGSLSFDQYRRVKILEDKLFELLSFLEKEKWQTLRESYAKDFSEEERELLRPVMICKRPSGFLLPPKVKASQASDAVAWHIHTVLLPEMRKYLPDYPEVVIGLVDIPGAQDNGQGSDVLRVLS